MLTSKTKSLPHRTPQPHRRPPGSNAPSHNARASLLAPAHQCRPKTRDARRLCGCGAWRVRQVDQRATGAAVAGQLLGRGASTVKIPDPFPFSSP